MRLRILIVLLPALGALQACTSSAQRAMQKTPDYKVGYSDGCSSASLRGANPRESGINRDDESYRSNPAYRLGWGQGFGACRQMAMPQTPGAMPRP